MAPLIMRERGGKSTLLIFKAVLNVSWILLQRQLVLIQSRVVVMTQSRLVAAFDVHPADRAARCGEQDDDQPSIHFFSVFWGSSPNVAGDVFTNSLLPAGADFADGFAICPNGFRIGAGGVAPAFTFCGVSKSIGALSTF